MMQKTEYRFRDLPKNERARLILQLEAALKMQKSITAIRKRPTSVQISQPPHN